MKKLINIAATDRRGQPPKLHCNVVVEPTGIDFLNVDEAFVAGTQDCGCGISPIPQTKKSNRRRGIANRS